MGSSNKATRPGKSAETERAWAKEYKGSPPFVFHESR